MPPGTLFRPHYTYIYLDVLSLPCVRLSGAKLVSWEHFYFGERLGTRLRPLIHRLTCRFSDHIVVLTEADRALYLKEGKRAAR